jgi:hypothetical protein
MATTIVLLINTFLFAAASAQPSSCPTTASLERAPFVPPAPHQSTAGRGSFWYGSERLWVRLNEQGRWRGLYRSDLRAYRNKIMLFRRNFDWTREHQPPLTVTARRLDGQSISVTSERAAGAFNEGTGPMIMTALDLPSEGCWSLSARYAEEPPLTFVVSVP